MTVFAIKITSSSPFKRSIYSPILSWWKKVLFCRI